MLRTSSELIRYAVDATDGRLGRVKDLLFDGRTWKVRAIVVETGDFLNHQDVLVEPCHVLALRFPEESLALSLTRKAIERLPNAATSPPVSGQVDGEAGDVHLRSSNETTTYSIAASDAGMGTIHGFVVDTSTWTIRYLIVDTGEWLMGKLVLLRPAVIQSIDWASRTMAANVTSEAIRHSPKYDERAELSRDYEAFLHDYYGWPHYWI